MNITRVGFGAWAIGGSDWAFGWGTQDDRESIAAIRHALERGVNWIDTAAIYGLGHSEEVVGRAVKSASRRPYVFTKCGIRWDADRAPYRSLKAASVAEELEASLRRLGVDTIDLYQIHWPDPEAEIEEAWGTLSRFREQGKVRWIGVSNFNVEQMKRVREIAPITSLQPPYSMLRPAIQAEILPYVRDCGIGVINYSPMVSGLLTGKMTAARIAAMPADDWRQKGIEFKEPRLSRNLRLVDLLREIGDGHSVSPGVVAVAWTLHNPGITAAIVGGRSAKQVEEISAALHYRLSEDEYEQIDSFLAANPV
jgi:aryl-alcohol dehydrogenase-like predicted oxidoreductase